MITKKIIRLLDGTVIYFGIPNSPEELDRMYELRYGVYATEKKYIEHRCQEGGAGKDIDDHDRRNTCVYFIAKINDEIVGTARIIKEIPLPTEKDYFQFVTPKRMQAIPPHKRVEIGRIISRPFKVGKYQVPRNMVMLGIFSTLLEYGVENGIDGGYGSMKESAYKKFDRLGVPMRRIRRYKQIFNPESSSDPLVSFFSKDDPVVLLYFLTSEVHKYFNYVFQKSGMFSKAAGNDYIVTKNFPGFFGRIIMYLKLQYYYHAH